MKLIDHRRPCTLFEIGGFSGVAMLVLVGAWACSPAENGGITTEVRDSAGITIVENTGPVEGAVPDWVVGTEPSFSVGTFQGDSLHQLFQVQGAARLPDGRVAVVNGGSGEVRVYGASGRFLHAFGRKGEGPGEFQRPALAGVLEPDTLVVVDIQLRRISLVHAEDGFLETARLQDEAGGALFPQGMFRNRTILVGGGFYWSSDSGGELTDGYTRRETSYRSVSFDGALAVDFGSFPGSEFFMRVQRSGGGMAMMASLIPFGKYAMTTVSGDMMYFGSGDAWEIQGYGTEGQLRRLIRWNREPVAVTAALLEEYVEEREEEAEDAAERREIRQNLEEMPIPETLPAFAGLHADALGYLWVERPTPPGHEESVFDILDPEGVPSGEARLPSGSEILEVGEDYVLTLFRDDLEVEYVRVHPLRRS